MYGKGFSCVNVNPLIIPKRLVTNLYDIPFLQIRGPKHGPERKLTSLLTTSCNMKEQARDFLSVWYSTIQTFLKSAWWLPSRCADIPLLPVHRHNV